MRNLIIIGNGFDLAHDLKTSYPDFKADVKKNGEKYDLPHIISHNYLLQSLLNDEFDLWSDIEVTYFDILTNFNDRAYLQKHYRDVRLYKNIKELNDSFDKIKKYLEIYLTEIEQSFAKIRNYEKIFQELDNDKTVVVNFNYTNTVKNYISHKNIELIHIHGELNNTENPIIFGFAAEDEESKKLLVENENDFVRNIKKFNYLFTNNDELLKEHIKSKEFNVFILGHSCGISDRLILGQILNSNGVHQIIPFYFRDTNGYFNTMVNIDRIIDDYSKLKEEKKSFTKLLSFPNSYKMPQAIDDSELINYLKSILSKKLPNEKRNDETSEMMRGMMRQ